MKKLTMKLFAGLIMFFFGFISINGQMFAKRPISEDLKPYLEKGLELINHGTIYTVEKTKDSKYIVKVFHADSKKMYSRKTYADKNLTVLDGNSIEWWDDGSIVSEGEYKAGYKQGFWRVEGQSYGTFVNNEKDGEWKTFQISGRDTLLVKLNNFKDGLLHGQSYLFDSLGNLADSLEYFEGKLLKSETDSKEKEGDSVPMFPGCNHKHYEMKALEKCSLELFYAHVEKYIRFPGPAKRKGIQGIVVTEFSVDKSGSIKDIVFKRGICSEFQNEVIRLFNNMPKWIPGKQNGEAIDSKMVLPIVFHL